MDAAPITPHGPIWRGAAVLVVDDEVLMRQLFAAPSKPKASTLKRLKTESRR